MDTLITLYLNQFVGSTVADTLILFGARWLIFFAVAAAVPVIIWRYYVREQRYGLLVRSLVFTGTATFIAWGVSEASHLILFRTRPFVALDAITPLFTVGGVEAFPSGHATASFALATAVWYVSPRTSIALFAAALLIGIARVAAGVHWPTDIYGGAVVGIGVVVLLRAVIRRFFVI